MRTKIYGKCREKIEFLTTFLLKTADNIDTVSNGFIRFHLKMKP